MPTGNPPSVSAAVVVVVHGPATVSATTSTAPDHGDRPVGVLYLSLAVAPNNHLCPVRNGDGPTICVKPSPWLMKTSPPSGVHGRVSCCQTGQPKRKYNGSPVETQHIASRTDPIHVERDLMVSVTKNMRCCNSIVGGAPGCDRRHGLVFLDMGAVNRIACGPGRESPAQSHTDTQLILSIVADRSAGG